MRIDERTLEKRKQNKNNKSMVNETKQTIYKN